MRKIVSIVFFSLIVFTSLPNTVTYILSPGRFGDNLFSFSHALWVSYKKNIPLLYYPFRYGSLLKLSQLHEHYDPAKQHGKYHLVFNKFDNKFSDFDKILNRSYGYTIEHLFMVPWFPPFKINWEDKNFIELLKKEIASIEPLPILDLPTDKLLVALHIRSGSGSDNLIQEPGRGVHTVYPNKLPPISFYIEQLAKLSQMLNNQPLYVHIFTDNPNPEKYVELLKKRVNKSNITYGYCDGKERHENNVLEDFFNLIQFKYFIRSTSWFSFMAEKLADWKISIVPDKTILVNGVLKTTRVKVNKWN